MRDDDLQMRLWVVPASELSDHSGGKVTSGLCVKIISVKGVVDR